MLYNLHDDLLPALRANDKKTWNAIHILLLRYGEGKHIVTLSRDTLKQIKANTTLGAAVERAVDDLRGRLDDRTGLRAAALVQVDVVPDTVEEGWAKFGNHDVYKLRASSVEELDHATAANLVVEALSDLTVVRRATEARALRHTKRPALPFPSVALEGVIGGGGSIGTVISERSRRRAPLIAVADSDRDAPESGAGSTLCAARDAVNKAACCPAQLVELPARELENLLPEGLIMAALTPGKQRLEAEQSARLRAARQNKLLFPNNAGRRYQQLKDELDENTLARCAELLDQSSPRDAQALIFTDDDGTWVNLTTLLAWWGCSNGKVRL